MTRVFFDMDGVLAEYKDVPLEEPLIFTQVCAINLSYFC